MKIIKLFSRILAYVKKKLYLCAQFSVSHVQILHYPRIIPYKTMKDEIVLYQPNEQFQLEVQLKDETVWL